MLVQVTDLEHVLAAAVEEPAHRHLLRYQASRREHPDDYRTCFWTDDNERPTLVVARQGASCFAVARELEGYRRLADDLRHERIEQDPPWPDEAARSDWGSRFPARGLFLNSSPLVLWELMCDAGFEPDPEDRKPRHAYLWTIEGEPRYSHLVKHPCRLGIGEELLPQLRQGITYDEEGSYVRLCLRRGPSFVCEVGGEKVCWAATHAGGTMAMIYTPPEHRRHGYARSLAAFQIDYMLHEYKVACAHVVATNVESQNLMRSFGARRIHDPVVWRVLYWPGEAAKARVHAEAQRQKTDSGGPGNAAAEE